MADRKPISSNVQILVNGNAIQNIFRNQVAEIIVDQHVHLPDMFSIRLYDPRKELLDKIAGDPQSPFNLTNKVEIKAANAQENKTSLIKGEITALEPQFNEGIVPELVVRGYDLSHRLYRETKSQAFINKKDSDLAEEIAQKANLSPEVESTHTVYDHIFQHNQSDLSFLMQRAWRIGFECFVDDEKLYFRSPSAETPGVTLKYGEDLLSFYPRMTLAEQVDEVVVKGWDVDKQEAIVGKAQEGNLYPDIKEEKDGAAWANGFGKGNLIIVDQPVFSQAEANTLATARLNELSGAFVQAEGVAYRRPELKAGKWIKLEGLGERFSGKYLVTAVTHVYSPDGLRSHFSVQGARTGALLDIARGDSPMTRWPGVVTGIVTNTDDPKEWGRVKIKFPWMTEDAESDWARIVTPGGGPEAGICAIPEVNDEVIVAFEHGDFSRPFILGGAWNGQHALPPPTANAATGERPLVRTWHSRTGHAITMYDDSDNKVEIKTAGGHTLTMDDANNKIEIKSSSGLTITLDGSGSNISIESGGNMSLKASGNLDIEASGQLNLKGATINLN